jgi:hypothetical protein
VVRVRHVVRAAVNCGNLSTPFGLLVGLLGRAELSRGGRGLVFATSYRLGFPAAPAFTIGNVVLTTHTRDELLARPRLLAHEERHTWQYLACVGLPMIPLYLLAAAWSWARAGDFASRNVFERLAGLADGGYPLRGPGSPMRILQSRPRA